MAEAENNITRPELRDPVAQEAKLVGDDVQEVREVPVEVVAEQVDAQVSQPREDADDKVNVHETVVKLDEVITDPSDPRAVQIPDAGRGSLDLPAHRLAAQTPEAVFAASASDEDKAEAPAEPQKPEPVEPASNDEN